jgi:hypothetical protein
MTTIDKGASIDINGIGWGAIARVHYEKMWWFVTHCNLVYFYGCECY